MKRMATTLARVGLDGLNMTFWLLLAVEMAFAQATMTVHLLGPECAQTICGEALLWGLVGLSGLACWIGYRSVERRIARVGK